MNHAAIRGVLFDLDGTLIDTAPDMIDSLNQLRAEQGLAALDYALCRTQVSHGSTGLVRLAFPDTPAPRFEQLRERFLELYNERVARDTQLFEGAVELLEVLERTQRPWGIVTNKPTFLTRPLLEAIGIGLRAGCVVAGDTLPERKPHPAPLLHAADLLGLAPAQCLYVGDAERDIQAARAAGMPVLLARYGYLGPEDHPERWGADGELASLGELVGWFA